MQTVFWVLTEEYSTMVKLVIIRFNTELDLELILMMSDFYCHYYSYETHPTSQILLHVQSNLGLSLLFL